MVKKTVNEAEVLDADAAQEDQSPIGGTGGEVLDASQAASTSTAIVSYEDELAAYAVEAAESEALGGTFLSTKNGKLAINGNPVAGNVLDCIVSATIMENAFYPGKFDPNNPAPPACYAFGDDETTMKPHPDVAKPIHSECFSCPNNQWKSDGDKGKACKNIRRLALLPADCVNAPSKIAAAERIYLKVPVTSVKEWGKYVHGVAAEFKRPPFAVITTISAVPDDKTQFKVTWKCKGKVGDPEAVQALIAAHKADEKSVGFPYPALSEAAVEEKNAKF